MELTTEDKAALLHTARLSVESAVRGGEIGEEPELTFHPNDKLGVFVTLYKKKMLRGCIGFLPGIVPLDRGLRDAAFNAARNDPRFPPVSPDELPEIELEISLLSPLRQVSNIDEIMIGRDGLYIEKDHRRGLLLPKVAVEHQWDVETFLKQTCLKAGLPQNAWRDTRTRIHIFTAEVVSEYNTPVDGGNPD